MASSHLDLARAFLNSRMITSLLRRQSSGKIGDPRPGGFSPGKPAPGPFGPGPGKSEARKDQDGKKNNRVGVILECLIVPQSKEEAFFGSPWFRYVTE